LSQGRPPEKLGVTHWSIYAKVDQDALAVLARPWPIQSSDGAS
jgi:hypothetical protein